MCFFMVFKVYSYFMHSRYGKQWETDSGTRLSKTYNSRGLVVFGGVFLFIIWLISCIQFWVVRACYKWVACLALLG
jgi:hypothetical protein